MNFKTFLTGLFAVFLVLSAVASVSALSVSGSLSGENSVPLFAGQNKTLSIGGVSGSASAALTSSVAGASISTPVVGNSAVNVLVSSITGTFKVGDRISTNLNVSDSVDSVLVPVVFARSFCSAGPRGNSLEISAVDISSDGDEDEQWKPLDTVTIDIDFENNGNEDLDDIIVELGLYDSEGRNQVGDLDFLNSDEEEIDYGDLDEGDDDSVTFEFQVPADMDEGNYKLVVKVYSDDTGQSVDCADFSSDLDNDFYHDIDVEAEDDEGKFIAFANVEFTPSEATCGDEVAVSFDAYNIGEDDEDQVRINVYSDVLDFDLAEEIKQGLDQGDHQSMTFTFTVPSGLSDGLYKINLDAEYDYKNGVYREQLDDTVQYSYKVFGCSVSNGNGNSGSTGAARISASLDSEAKAGEQLVVTATITNRLTSAASFVVDASGFSSWASLDSVSNRIVSLDAGESVDVELVFNVKDTASGEQSFLLETTSGNKVDSREVVVNIAPKSGFSLSGNSGLIWAIALVNVVLLIVIIVVAIRVARN